MSFNAIQMIYYPSNDYHFLFWCMDVPFSRLVLQNLLEKGLRPSAIFLPGSGEPFLPNPINKVLSDPRSTSISLSSNYLHESIYQTAREQGIPVYVVQSLSHIETIETIRDMKAGAAFVACFPKRIPKALLDLPQLRFINLHPSLLPELRGPYPLFWTFRLARQPGITLHLMDEGFDTGNIVKQEEINFADGISGLEADRIMAQAGVELICEIFPQLVSGKLKSTVQAGSGSSFAAPTAEDFTIPTSWAAKRAFNFISGTAEWNIPYLIKGRDFQIIVRAAETFSLNEHLTESVKQEGNLIWVQFNPGILHARK